MEPDAFPDGDNSSTQPPPAPSMRPLISKNRGATIRHRSALLRLVETRVPTIGEIQAYRSTHPGFANNASLWPALVDAGKCVSSVASLTILRRSNVPSLLQRLANLGLRELFLLGKIFVRVPWLPVFRDKLRRLHVLGFPIEIENLIFGAQEIFRVPMAFQAPSHAVRLGLIDHRHVIDRPVATETTDASIHVRRMIVINVIDRAMNPHPIDRLTCLPTGTYWLQLWVVLLHLGMAVHAQLRVGHVRVRSYFHEAVTIPAIHPQLGDVNIVRKRHWLDRLIPNLGVFWRDVIPGARGQSTHDH